jgi:uncharacterized protein
LEAREADGPKVLLQAFWLVLLPMGPFWSVWPKPLLLLAKEIGRAFFPVFPGLSMSFFLLGFLLLSCGPKEAPKPAASVQPALGAPLPDGARAYTGAIEIPGMALEFQILLQPFSDDEGPGWVGTIDIPLQKAYGLPLTELVFDGENIQFSLLPPGASEKRKAVFQGRISGASVEGTFTQSRRSFPFRMEETDSAPEAPERPERPQTPKPPFPYPTEDLVYRNEAAGIELAGTLSLPAGPGPHPAALLVTGSGAQDRDETIFDHRPFAVIADHFARMGIATLRVDDRGVGGTGGDLSQAVGDDLVSDIETGLAYLKDRPEIDPERVGIVGHSEGASLAPSAADSAAFLVLLAGTGLPGRDILLDQGEHAYRLQGASEDQLADLMDAHAAALDEASTDAEGFVATRELIRLQLSLSGTTPEEDDLDAMADAASQSLRSPAFRSFIRLDPRPALAAAECPLLVLNGSLDTQVDPRLNLPGLRKASESNPDASIHELEGLNHLFQHAVSGELGEYALIEETFAPEALELMGGWILDRFGSAPKTLPAEE